MNKEIILQIFKAAYNRQSFIDNVLLPTIQGKVDNLIIYDQYGEQEVHLTASEEQYAKSAVKYGEFTTRDEIGRTVELYEVILHDHKQVERSRVGIAALIKKQIIGNNAVLVNFAYENPQNRSWRFSFVAHDAVFTDGEMVQSETNPKRYTYVFGEPDETYRTALDRFYTLAHKYEITVDALKDAFGVEAMSKAFFDEYRDIHYNGFVDYLTRSNFKQSVFNGNEKAIRDFVKKLLGRIVFLYFIQKKGWLGASNGEYKDGDRNFMSNFYKKAGANESFYATWLSKLFFETLNQQRPNDAFEMPDGTSVKVPYLNGGLFEKESNQYDYLTFPADLFSELFDFFDQYNFTIYEDSPEEHTVAVDPEMLGHIFENLLEDNKDKGAFYTPKEIVHYMTQESLIEYLHTQIPDADRKQLEAFVKNKDNELSDDHKKQIGQKLDAVKICDPAIGSGAFPMGLLQEIFGMKERIAYDLGYSVWSPATVKEHIIQNSIYGVDIEQGAVDIARLRFWLSLIVDEDMPKPLPNLEYKIVVGNSLVSKFEDEIIEIDWDKKGSVGDADKHVKAVQFGLQSISEKQKKYFTSKSIKEKEKIKAEIKNLKLDVLISQLLYNKAFYLNKNQKIVDMGFGLKAKEKKKNLEIDLKVAEFNNTLKKLKHLKEHPDKPFKHFDWKLDFPEVLNPMTTDYSGFDIVIGNPPWVSMKGKHGLEESKRNDLGELMNKYNGNKTLPNLFEFFTLLSLDYLLKPSSVFCFIIPDRLGFNVSFYNLREKILTEFDLLEIVYKWKFEGIIADTMTLLLKKSKPTETLKIQTRPDSESFEYSISEIRQNANLEFRGYSSLSTKEIVKYFKETCAHLSDYTKSTSGFGGKSKLITETKESEDQIEVLKGSSIGRYKLFQKLYFEFNDRNLTGRTRDPEKLGKQEKILLRKTGNRIIATYDDSGAFPEQSLYFLYDIKLDSKALLGIINSKLMTWYFLNQLVTNEDSTPQIKNYHLDVMPIKVGGCLEIISVVVDVLLIQNEKLRSHSTPVKNYLPQQELEEVIDALVFELYFPEEFQSKGITIEKYAKELFKPIDNLSEAQKIEQIKAVYEELRKKENPLRNQIKLMKIELKDLLLPILSV